jgi:hypothetical protein
MSRLPNRPVLSLVVEVISLAIASAWLVGRIVADRWIWSQWLSWIPSPCVVVAAAVAAGAVWACRRQSWRVGMALQAIAVAAGVIATVQSDVGLPWGSGQAPTDAVRLIQWNTGWPAGDDPRSAEALARVRADLFLISNRGAITSPDIVRGWAGPDARVVGAGPFALVTHLPVIEARQVGVWGLGRSRCWVGRFVVAPPAWNGRTLRIAMVDLPSRPTMSRAMIARQLADVCDEGALGEVDLVAGDFNALDGSVTITSCFPGMRDAMREVGQGWLATWPRRFPLWQIDHVLLAPTVEAFAGRAIDPGVGDHRMSAVTVRAR